MYLSELKIWNFRKYGTGEGPFETSSPGLSIKFHKGVNVLVGENDSGKTTIIDAIRYTLRTQSGEFIQFDEKDFHQISKDKRADEFKIECTFDGLDDKDAGLFFEWVNFDTDKKAYTLKIWLYAKMKDNVIHPTYSAGSGNEGIPLDFQARNLLRAIYLKPLRDALTDMTHGYKSRFAQILSAHNLFFEKKNPDGTKNQHQLEKEYGNLKDKIDGYFKGDKPGAVISNDINEFLTKHFLINGDDRKAVVQLTGEDLLDILHQLDLVLGGNKSGLGSLNLLCIAAELLLMKQQQEGLRLALVEEIEAHLHPQYQLRLIDYIVNESKSEQFILTTHSITLASKIKLKNLIVIKGNNVYPMSEECTCMTPSDYNFMERFLDATKANLFFARGLILVEGDAENLLIPSIAKLLDRPLHKYGVSIVNMGNTAYKRYLSIFKRKDGKTFDMPISIVTDLDVRSLEYYKDNGNDAQVKKMNLWKTQDIISELKEINNDINYENFPKFINTKNELEQLIRDNKKETFNASITNVINNSKAILKKENRTTPTIDLIDELRQKRKSKLEETYNNDIVNIYIPQNWTLEYDIARSRLYKLLYFSVLMAEKASDTPSEILDDVFMSHIADKVLETYPEGHELNAQDSYDIFKPLNDGDVSKAITAQYMCETISGNIECADRLFPIEDIKQAFKDDPYLKYLTNAITHVTEL